MFVSKRVLFKSKHLLTRCTLPLSKFQLQPTFFNNTQITRFPLARFCSKPQSGFDRFKNMVKDTKKQTSQGESSSGRVRIERKPDSKPREELKEFLQQKEKERNEELFQGKITSSSTLTRMKDYMADLTSSVSQKLKSRKEADLQKEEALKSEFQAKLDQQNKRLDAKVVESTVKSVVDHLERNMNRQFYDEVKAEIFFEKVFAFEPKNLLENKRFKKFLDEDLLLIIQNSNGAETLMNWSKFVTYFKVDDPYVWSTLRSRIAEKIKSFHCDQLLVICVNAAHSLSSEASHIFDIVGMHLSEKLDKNYNAPIDETLMTEEDLIKFLTVFSSYKMLKPEIITAVNDYVKDNTMFIKYETVADIAVIFALNCSNNQMRKFLEENMDKVMNNIPFASDEVYYKFLWSLSYSKALDPANHYTFLKTFESEHKNFSNKLFIRSLLLLSKDIKDQQKKLLYNKIEEDLVQRLGKMSLSDLLDVMWWALQQDNKSEHLLKALQKEIRSRVSAFKDQELITFLQCFVEHSTEFSVKLLKSVLAIIEKKLTKLEKKTLVSIVWVFSRLNLQNDEQVENLFVEIKEEISPYVSKLNEKTISMLFWSYSKVKSPDQAFLEKLKSSIMGVNQPNFDNFDLTLIVQSCKIQENTFLKEDPNFMSTSMAMLSFLESQVTKQIGKMNIHQFMTISTYFLENSIGSTNLVTTFKNKVVKHLEEFDKVLLALLRSAFGNCNVGENGHVVQVIEDRIDEVHRAEVEERKEMDMMDEMREVLRRKIEAMRLEKERKKRVEAKLGIDKRVRESAKSPNTQKATVEETQDTEDFLSEKELLSSKISNLFKDKRPSKPTETPKSTPKPSGASSNLLKDYLKNRKENA